MGDLLLLRHEAVSDTPLPGLPLVSTPADRAARDRATAEALRAYLRTSAFPERSPQGGRVDVRL